MYLWHVNQGFFCWTKRGTVSKTDSEVEIQYTILFNIVPRNIIKVAGVMLR